MAVYEITDNPEQEKNTYAVSINKAVSDFLARDKKLMADAAGAVYDGKAGFIETVFIGRPYVVNCLDGTISPKGHDVELRGLEISVALHNLTSATGRKLTGKLVTKSDFLKVFGASRSGTNDATGIEFNRIFSDHPQRLSMLLKEFPGELGSHGDASIKIDLLPRVPIIIAVWAGEDGIIPSEHAILYDSTAADYLPLEDLVAAPLFMLEKFIAWGKRNFQD